MAQPMTMNQAVPDVAPTGSLAFAGSVAGMAGGLAMATYLVLAAVAQGLGPLAALEPVGAIFRDPATHDGGAGGMLPGLFLHLGVSALLGLLFATVLPREYTPGNAGFLCVGFTFAVMGFMASAVVPAVNPVLQASFHGLGGSWVIAHAVFGMTVGYVCQRLRRRPGPLGNTS